MTKSISVVIPIFKSKRIIDDLCDRMSQTLSNISSTWEVILVDDASNDGTFERMLELHKRDSRFKVIRFSKNMGQHHATLYGLKHAQGDYVFTIDDDLQNAPEEMPNFISKIDQGYDLVIGSIVGGKKHNWIRNLASRTVQIMVSIILSKPKNIQLSSYRCMTRRVVNGVCKFKGNHVYIPALLLAATPTDRMCNVPVQHFERKYGKSTYTPRKLFQLFSYLVINHSRIPLRIVTVWGLLISGLSIGYATIVIMKYFIYDTYMIGWPSIIVLILFLSGNILFFLGILGEYIGRLVDENSHASQFPVFEEHI